MQAPEAPVPLPFFCANVSRSNAKPEDIRFDEAEPTRSKKVPLKSCIKTACGRVADGVPSPTPPALSEYNLTAITPVIVLVQRMLSPGAIHQSPPTVKQRCKAVVSSAPPSPT